MSFWDNVRKFTQPYADDDYDEYEDDESIDDEYEEEEEPAASRFGRNDIQPEQESKGFNFDSNASFAPSSSSMNTSSSGGFSGQVVNMSSAKQQVVLFRPVNFNDTSKAADDLRNKKAVIVNMENVDKAMARRVVDFLSGCVYAIDGKVRKVAQSTYLFCPHNMDVTGELENIQSEVESYI